MYDENPNAQPAAKVLEGIAQQDVEDSELAGLGTRLLGAIIDGLLIMAFILPWMYVSGFLAESTNGRVSVNHQLQGVAALFFGYLQLNGYLLARHGQTIGKRLLGMRIVSVRDGQTLPLWKVLFLRHLSIGLVSLIPFIGYLLAIANPLLIFRKDRRCFHDHLAGSKVIRVSK